MTEFTSALYYLKKPKGLTFRELADALDVADEYFCSVTRGECLPSEDLLQKIASFFELSETEKQFLCDCAAKPLEPIIIGENCDRGGR